MTTATQSNTGTQNCHYNLVSAPYHSLESVATYAQYIADAKDVGDQELVSFFEDLREDNWQRSERAKSLLKTRL